MCNLRFVVSFICFVVTAHARDIESAGYVTALQKIFPNLERVANAPPFYDALALDSTRAGRPSAALLETSRRFGNAFLYHRIGHTTVTRSAQPTLRWQLHLLRCGSSRAGYRIRWICNSVSNISPSPPRASRERTSVFCCTRHRPRLCEASASHFTRNESPPWGTHFRTIELKIPPLHGVRNRRSVGKFKQVQLPRCAKIPRGESNPLDMTHQIKN